MHLLTRYAEGFELLLHLLVVEHRAQLFAVDRLVLRQLLLLHGLGSTDHGRLGQGHLSEEGELAGDQDGSQTTIAGAREHGGFSRDCFQLTTRRFSRFLHSYTNSADFIAIFRLLLKSGRQL
ncbi:hypothetical protein D9M71_489400 [compost metagenome]